MHEYSKQTNSNARDVSVFIFCLDKWLSSQLENEEMHRVLCVGMFLINFKAY